MYCRIYGKKYIKCNDYTIFYSFDLNSMKSIIVLLGIAIMIAVWFGIYKSTNLFTGSLTIPSQASVKESTDTLKKQGEQELQKVASGAQNLVQSWQKLLDQKSEEAKQYLQQQKEQLKQQAQQKLEEEAKKKIQWVFSGM